MRSDRDEEGPGRITVHGASGSGKTRLARLLAESLGVESVELDSLFHQAEWTPVDPEIFRSQVAAIAASERWVVEGNYQAVRELLWARAELIVVIDLPRWLVMVQLSRRTLTRMLAGTVLWNGNRERLRNLVSTDEEKNILLWSWRTHGRFRVQLPEEAARSGADVVVLSSRRKIDRFVASLPGDRGLAPRAL